MKTNPKSQNENHTNKTRGAGTITLQRAKEIMTEEEIEYSDDEMSEVLQFVSKIVVITTCQYERANQQKTEAKIIAINTNTTHETKSLPLHPCEHRRAS